MGCSRNLEGGIWMKFKTNWLDHLISELKAIKKISEYLLLSYVSNYGSALGQTTFLQIIIEEIKVGDTEVTRPPYWLWLNQMLSGLKQEDVFSVLVNLAIVLSRAYSKLWLPVIFLEVSQRQGEGLRADQHRARERRSGDGDLSSLQSSPHVRPLCLSLPSFASFLFAICAVILLNNPV